jgi:hypothetical protein
MFRQELQAGALISTGIAQPDPLDGFDPGPIYLVRILIHTLFLSFMPPQLAQRH